MKFTYRRSVVSLVRLLYLAGLVFLFYLGWQIGWKEISFFNAGYYVVLLSYTALLLVFMSLYGGLRVGSLRITNLLLSCIFALLFTNFFIYFELSLINNGLLDVVPILCVFGAQALLAALGCYLMNTVYYALTDTREVVAVCDGDPGDAAVIDKMSRFDRRFHVVRVLDSRLPLEELIGCIAPHDSVLLGGMDPATRSALFQYCYRSGKRINVIPNAMDIAMSVATKTQLFDSPILLCKNREPTPEQRLIKRVMDLVIASLGLVIFSPLMLVLALAIKLYDGGPVFFRQTRLTLGGKPFSIFKYRSMRVDADKHLPEGVNLAQTNDSRITRVGRFMRPYRLDELPQLLNVLMGDMSIVGPRPEQPDYHLIFASELPEFALRLRAKAGMTGFAQVYGRYNTTPRDKLNMDLFYTEDFSIVQDIKLMFMTLKILFVRESTEGFAETPAPPSSLFTIAAHADSMTQVAPAAQADALLHEEQPTPSAPAENPGVKVG